MTDYFTEDLLDEIPESSWDIHYPSIIDYVELGMKYNTTPDKFSFCNVSPRFTNYFENPEEIILDGDDRKALKKWEEKYKFLFRLRCNNNTFPKSFLSDCHITEFYDEVVPIVYQIK